VPVDDGDGKAKVLFSPARDGEEAHSSGCNPCRSCGQSPQPKGKQPDPEEERFARTVLVHRIRLALSYDEVAGGQIEDVTLPPMT